MSDILSGGRIDPSTSGPIPSSVDDRDVDIISEQELRQNKNAIGGSQPPPRVEPVDLPFAPEIAPPLPDFSLSGFFATEDRSAEIARETAMQATRDMFKNMTINGVAPQIEGSQISFNVPTAPPASEAFSFRNQEVPPIQQVAQVPPQTSLPQIETPQQIRVDLPRVDTAPQEAQPARELEQPQVPEAFIPRESEPVDQNFDQNRNIQIEEPRPVVTAEQPPQPQQRQKDAGQRIPEFTERETVRQSPNISEPQFGSPQPVQQPQVEHPPVRSTDGDGAQPTRLPEPPPLPEPSLPTPPLPEPSIPSEPVTNREIPPQQGMGQVEPVRENINEPQRLEQPQPEQRSDQQIQQNQFQRRQNIEEGRTENRPSSGQQLQERGDNRNLPYSSDDRKKNETTNKADFYADANEPFPPVKIFIICENGVPVEYGIPCWKGIEL